MPMVVPMIIKGMIDTHPDMKDHVLTEYFSQQFLDTGIMISQAWQGTVTAHKRYEAEIKAEESSALAYRYVLKRYDAGMATLFDLNQSRQQWFTASENALRMKFEFLIRKKILDIIGQQ